MNEEVPQCICTANGIINSAEGSPAVILHSAFEGFCVTHLYWKRFGRGKSNMHVTKKSVRVFIIQHSRTKILSLKCFLKTFCEQLGHKLLSVSFSD